MAAAFSAQVCLLFDMLVRAMVDAPESVKVKAFDAADVTIITVEVARADIGKLIGRSGRTARSLRTVLSVIAHSQQQQFRLHIDGDTVKTHHEA